MSPSDNQKMAPIGAAFVKQFREVFGDDQVKVLYVNEGGLVLGERGEEIGAPCVHAADGSRLSDLLEKK